MCCLQLTNAKISSIVVWEAASLNTLDCDDPTSVLVPDPTQRC